ncbi:MAG: hypothetical protein H0T83_02995 [Chthoniobacterales bacterium]|nr:hypothetical protein [Chthoniobacterales bacterium]
MIKHHGLNSRLSPRMISYRPAGRGPRGLAMLRALRLRLAEERHPRLQQAEFQFGK